MNLKRIAILLHHPLVACWNFQSRQAELLRSLLPDTELAVCRTEEEFLHALPACDGCMVWGFQQKWFDVAKQLKILSTPAAGKDYFRVVPPPGVFLMNGQFHGKIIAETVLGMLLSLSRGILSAVTTLRQEAWPREAIAPQMQPLRGSHAVIVGFGHIGQQIGKLLSALEVRITGIRRNISGKPAPQWFTPEDRMLPISELDQILPEADHLILALPATNETSDLIDGHRIQLMKPTADIINIGRGNAIDEMALCTALGQHRISAAFLDVFSQEPIPENSRLLQCPNLWRLPHASAISPDYLDLYVRDFVRQLQTGLLTDNQSADPAPPHLAIL